MFTPIYNNEFFIKFNCSNISEEIEDLLSFICGDICLNIFHSYLELKMLQSEEVNTRSIINLLKDESFNLILFEGKVFPDYKRKIILEECTIVHHEQRFNYSDTRPNYNYIVLSYKNMTEQDNPGDEEVY